MTIHVIQPLTIQRRITAKFWQETYAGGGAFHPSIPVLDKILSMHHRVGGLWAKLR